MTLTLSVLRCPDSVAPETHEIAGGEFTLGRGPGNDWVLADPERHLSKRHCVLAFRSGSWQLADVSTNGTFLNREENPVGPGAGRALRDGDRIRVGPYEIEVRIADDARASDPTFATAPPGQDFLDPFGDDPFAPRPTGLGAAPPAFGSPPDPGLPFGPSHGDPPPAVALPPDFDPLAPDPAEDPFGGPVQPDHSEAIEDAFRPPRPQGELLPDDWDLDVAPSAPTPMPAAAPAPPSPPPVAPPVAPAVPLAPARTAGAGEADLFAAFLDGAGAQDAAVGDAEATMRALGAAFRALVGGVRQILIGRQAIKGEFRIEQTMVRARGNNPLKFSTGDDDALAALLGVGRRTDMGPAEAVADALKDIRLHELASIAAMQSAVRALLTRFDPAVLRGAADGGFGALGGRKARAWEAFEKLHAEVSTALADDFDSVFGKAFARAYEQALAEISSREEPS